MRVRRKVLSAQNPHGGGLKLLLNCSLCNSLEGYSLMGALLQSGLGQFTGETRRHPMPKIHLICWAETFQTQEHRMGISVLCVPEICNSLCRFYLIIAVPQKPSCLTNVISWTKQFFSLIIRYLVQSVHWYHECGFLLFYSAVTKVINS